MNTKKLVSLVALLAFGTVVCAQDYAFKVLVHKGSSEVKSGADWQPLKTGATLLSGDEVKLGSNSYIGLVHKSGKPVEVKEMGVHKISELESKIPVGSSVLNKYTDFILSSVDESGRNRLSATGAVTREVHDAQQIKVFLPENTAVFNKTVVIAWDATAKGGPYVVTLLNMFEDVILKAETSANRYSVDLSDPKLAKETAILIKISSKADARVVSKRHVIKEMSKAEQERVSAEFQKLKAEVDEETAFSQYILAGFYEQNELLADAIVAYDEALRLEPEAYSDAYEDFLIRNKLK